LERERRLGSSALRRGFTLVEVIVVLVILAILAAIAIPALTGYIDKAQDKQYIAEARNISVALKTVLSEAYASGEINDVPFESNPSPLDYFTTSYWGSTAEHGAIFYDTEGLSRAIYQGEGDKSYALYKKAAALIGESYPDEVDMGSERYWKYFPVSENDSGATMLTADGFYFWLYPEGNGSNPVKPFISVTYKMKRIDVSDMEHFLDSMGTYASLYDPNAGFEVYHFETY
jgi:prepilin-type N-terminal cleavage/methylation domain-containing protein